MSPDERARILRVCDRAERRLQQPELLSPFPRSQTRDHLVRMLLGAEARLREAKVNAADLQQLVRFAEDERQGLIDALMVLGDGE